MSYLDRFQTYVNNIKTQTEALFPIESRKKRLEIKNVRVADTGPDRLHNWSEFQKTKENDRSFLGRIVADVTLTDKATGAVLDSKKGYTLNVFPHVTALGSYVVGGKDLQVVNQLRRRPGAYPVIASDNNAVTKVTAAGLNHDAILDRETGQLLLKVRSSHLKLVPLLQEMGIARTELEKHLGQELVAQNQPKEGARSELLKFYQMNRRVKAPSDPEELRKSVVTFLASKRVDPNVTEDTLGHRHESISPQLYLHAAKAAVDVAKGTRQPADMESLIYKSIHSVEDFVDESMKEAYPHLKRRLAYLMDRKKDIKSFLNTEHFSKPIISKFVASEFTRYSDQSNPLEILGTMHTVTSMGEGGIQSTHAITDALRNVHSSHFGFLDALHTPENSAIGVVGHLASGVRKEGNQLVRDVYDTHEGKIVAVSPIDVAKGGIAFADQYKMTRAGKMEPVSAKITAILPGGAIDQVHHSKIRYVLPKAADAFSVLTNAIPFLHTNSANRMLMADRHMEQSVPLTEREAPIVQASVGGVGYDKILGAINTHVADGPGRVKSVRDDHIQVVYDKDPGTVRRIYYTDAYPLNAGTVLKMSPLVKQGQRLKSGMPLFETNFSKGDSFALGKHLTTAIMPWRGFSVSGDTLVLSYDRDGNGKLQPIRDVDDIEQMEAFGTDKAGSTRRMAVHAYIGHQTDVGMYCVQTSGGRHVKATECHSFVTCGANGDLVEIPPEQMVVGKTLLPIAHSFALCAPHQEKQSITGRSQLRSITVPLNNDVGFLFGLFVAEGSCTGRSGKRKGVCFAVTEPALVSRLTRILRSFGIRYRYRQSYGIGKHGQTTTGGALTVSSSALAALFQKQCGEYSHGKRVPDCLWSAPRSFIDGFLDGYWSGDGTVTRKELCCASTSRKLAVGVQLVLAAVYGVQARLHTYQPKNKKYRQIHLVSVSREHVHKFPTITSEHRAARLAILVKAAKKLKWSFDRVPVPENERVAVEKLFPGRKHLLVNGWVSRAQLHKRRDQLSPIMLRLLDANVWWEVVTAVQPVKAESYVYDLDMRPVGTFMVEGGLVVHNTYEDGMVISEAAAKKMTSEHLTEHKVEREPGVQVGFERLYAVYPAEREKSSTHRMPKVGDVVKPGQLLIPAVRESAINPDTDYAKVHKALRNPFVNSSVYWEGTVDGVVKKVVQNSGVVKVYVESHEPIVVGDKMSVRSGSKGIVSCILPQDQMPRLKDGTPIDVLFNPYGLPGRVNPTFLFENAASKIARKTGKTYEVPAFDTTDSIGEKIVDELKKHGLSDTETVVDPVHGKEHKNVMVGENYWFKLRHQVKKKWAARSHEGAYTIDERPSRGGHESAQGVGPLDLYALLANGHTKLLRDMSGLKSGKNSEYWTAFQLGVPTPPPKRPMILDKFETYLQGAGINVQRQGDTLKASPFTDKDILARSSGRIIEPQVFRVSKTGLQPERGGLFDPEVTGGHGSTKWSHLELAERVLNPLYEAPVKAITGLSTGDLDEILAGKKMVDNKTGGEAIAAMLRKVDVKHELASAAAQVRTAPASKRDALLRKLRYLSSLNKLGMDPVDAYTNKYVPVVPTKFRPIYDLPDGSLNVSDVNHGYREMLFINRELERLKGQGVGAEHLAGLREGLYKAYSGLIGLTEPVTRSGHFKGFISQIAGNQNKHGLYQAKVIMRRQDLSGRSTIINAPHLGMDEVGVPEKMAREMYKPYLVRSLVNLAGLKPVDARKEVETGSDRVNSLLDDEMKRRPLLLNRAPALHKFSEVALIPHRVPGEAIHLNPLVFAGANADVDGNCISGSTEIYLRLPSELVSCGDQFEPEIAMSVADSEVFLKTATQTVIRCRMDQVPFLKETGRKDRNGASLYDVPEGIEVLTTLPDGSGTRWSAVTMYTVEDGCKLRRVETKRGREVVCSDNESLAVLDPLSLQLVRRRPDDSLGCAVAVAHHMPSAGSRYGHEMGWLIGAWLSDGWCNNVIGYTKASQVKRDKFISVVEAVVGEPVRTFTYAEQHCAETNAGISGASVKIHIPLKTESLKLLYQQLLKLVDHAARDAASARGEPDRTCLFKRMPSNLAEFSREALLGVLVGLLEGDGTLQISRAKGKPQVMASFATSSKQLRDGLILLGKLLGVRVTYTTQEPRKGRAQRATAYAIRLSTVDLYRLLPEMTFTEETDVVRFFRNNPPTKDDLDVVPVPLLLLRRFYGANAQANAVGYSPDALQTIAARDRKQGYALIARQTARALINCYLGEHDQLFTAFSNIVADETTHWDKIASVKSAPTERVYDLEVVDTKVFALANGLVVYDTVGLHVPHSELAREELLKALPSRNMLSPKSGDVIHTVGKEATLGLYMATRPDKNAKTVSVKSPLDAVEKYNGKQIELNTPLAVAGRDGVWTVGHFLFNAAVPEQYKLKSPTTVDGKHYKKLVNSIAHSHPNEAGQAINALKDLGFDASTRLGFSINLKSLTENNVERDKVAKEVEQIMKTDPVAAIKHAEKRLEEILDKHITEDNPYALMTYKSGASAKHKLNVRQLILAPGGVTDLKGKIVPVPLMRSYADGLTMPQYWATLPGARKGIAERAVSTQDTGAFTKELVNTTIGVRVTDTDCGTKEGIDLPADHPDLPGRWIAAGPHAGQLITHDLAVQLRKEGRAVHVRSPMTCALTSGICQRCAGKNEAGKDHQIGFHIGAYAGTTISEPITQMVLRCIDENAIVLAIRCNDIPQSEMRRRSNVNGYSGMTLREVAEDIAKFGAEGVAIPDWSAGESWTDVTAACVHDPDDAMYRMVLDTGTTLIAQGNHPQIVVRKAYEDIPDSIKVMEEVEEYTALEIIDFADCLGRFVPLYLHGYHKVVSLDRVDNYRGKVVDLKTVSGHFVVNGLLTHNSFHTGGAVGSKEVGYKRIRQLFTMPQNIRGKATLASETGTVDAVVDTARGGWDVTVAGVKHFVPTELGLAVKQGDHVKQGDQLSQHGVLKLQEVAEFRGHEAARDQLIKDLDDEMSSAGQNIRRRIYEVALRPIINKVEVLDPGDAAKQGVVVGDILNANYVKDLNKTLKVPVDFKPIIMSIREVPFENEDFVGPLMYQRLPRTLREAPAIGAVTHLKGDKAHPLVEYAWGNIGDDTPDKKKT